LRAAALTTLALVLVAAPSADAAGRGARIQGTWTMDGLVTRAHGVRGEHRGQRVRRTWLFVSPCGSGPCRSLRLLRERAGGNVAPLVLRRRRTNHYTGHGRFFFALRCNGHVYRHGGIARYTLRLHVTRSAVVQATHFATAISAAYTNVRRVNRTPCPGTLGRDAGRYSGGLTSALPTPPTADFGSSIDPFTSTVAFTDRSSSPVGAAIVRRSWDFGDPQSGAANTSTGRNPSHRYPGPGNYTVTLIVTDANGLTATVTRQVVG
jgi:hypothetical protein